MQFAFALAIVCLYMVGGKTNNSGCREMNQEEISVIISTYSKNMMPNVLDCVHSLENQTTKPSEILLILDNDPELIRFYKSTMPSYVKVLSSNGFGLSNARNAGVEHAKGDIIVFIDDDAIADQNWLSNIARIYSEPSVAGVGGLVLPLWAQHRSFEWFPEELYWIIGCSYKGQSNRREPIRNPIGCNMSFRKSVFEKVGGFRHDVGRLGKVLLDGEEPEFSMRVYQTIPGAIIMNEPSAVVRHKVSPKRMTVKYIFKRSFYQGYSKALINERLTKTSLDLNMERNYLKYLVSSSIITRINRYPCAKNLSQIAVLFISSCLVLVGFVIGKVRRAVD